MLDHWKIFTIANCKLEQFFSPFRYSAWKIRSTIDEFECLMGTAYQMYLYEVPNLTRVSENHRLNSNIL